MWIGLKPVLVLFVALGIGAMPMDAVEAAQKSGADSSSVPRVKSSPARKKPVAAPGAGVKAKAKAKAKTGKTPVKSTRSRQAPDVRSSAALVVEQAGGGALFQKNAGAVVPIASISKLMTAMVVLDEWPDLRTRIRITTDDIDYLRGSRSRLPPGASMTRETALLLALMSSENRAAHALARNHPGGMPAFVAAMNRKARSLGMNDTRFEDPTGLSSNNVSTARDLAKLVDAAYRYPLIREFSTKSGTTVKLGGQTLEFRNTNPLVRNASWNVGLSKTGYIREAGECLVMQVYVANRPVVIVLLDSVGKQARVGDANRIKRWMETVLAAYDAKTRQIASTTRDAIPG